MEMREEADIREFINSPNDVTSRYLCYIAFIKTITFPADSY
jgi:hypothetical protein